MYRIWKKIGIIFCLFWFFGGGVSSAIAQEGGALSDVKQISTGMANYGYSDSVYYQYTGNDIFSESNPPTGFFTNLNFMFLNELEYYLPKGFGYGLEWMRFASSSESSYLGEEDVVGPEVNMTLDLMSFTLRGFFMNPFNETIQPYLGVGWGFANATFDTTLVGGKQYKVTAIGLMNYRSIGTQILFTEKSGMSLELRSITANKVKTSQDPFERSDTGDLYLDFGGTMLNFMGFLRF